MDYQKIYNQIIERAKNRKLKGYKEKHHIIPKCMGGLDEKENIVELTAREHFLSHWLLHQIYPENNKLFFAFKAMCDWKNSKRKNYIPSSKVYEYTKIELSKRMKEITLNVPKNHGEKIRKLKNKKVTQYDLEGNFIKTYLSVKQAGKENNISSSMISNCCNKIKNKTAGGFLWEWSNNKPGFSWNKIQNKKKKIYQYDLEGNFIKKWNSITEITSVLNIHRDSITYSVYNKKPRKGYYWCFKKQKPSIKLLYQLNNNNEIINVFINSKEAEITLKGKNADNINACLRGKQKTAYGYKWVIK